MNALLIDSDLESLAALERLLFQDGRLDAIRCCADPASAWPQIRRTRPDVVFLETRFQLSATKAKGIDLAMRIRRNWPLIHLIFVSSEPNHAYAAFQAFPLAFITKPFRAAGIQAVMDRLFVQAASVPIKRPNSQARQHDANSCPLRCFGEYEIVDPHRPSKSIRLPGRFSRDLLAYLVVHQDRTVTRSELLVELLSGRYDERAINLLHVHLYRLRQFLNRTATILNGAAIHGRYRLAIPDGVCDIVDFARHVRQQTALSETTIAKAEAIAALYRGPCFAGEDYPWAENIRAELEIGHEQLLLRIAEYRWSVNESTLSEQALQTLIRINPLSEAGHCTLLDQYLKRNDRHKFINGFERYRRIMREELDAPVDRHYQQAYQRIRHE